MSEIGRAATVRGSLFVLSAPSGAGKTTLAHAVIRRLAERGIAGGFSVSYTTRAPRPGERPGRDYHFVDEAEFQAMVAAGELLEHAEVFGRHYGTGRQATEARLALGESLFLDIDWQGARQIRAALPEPGTSIFILPPSRAVLAQRLAGRGQDSVETVAARMAAAVGEMSHCAEFDYLIVNDDLDCATAQLESICIAQSLRQAAQARRHAALIAELLAVQ